MEFQCLENVEITTRQQVNSQNSRDNNPKPTTINVSLLVIFVTLKLNLCVLLLIFLIRKKTKWVLFL